MKLKEGDTGTIRFGDGSKAKVKVEKVHNYSHLPTDYMFSYDENETNRKLKHPKFGEMFFLPEGLADMVFTKDKK